MLDVFNFPTPQQSNYQEFYGSVPPGAGNFVSHTWSKPRGASMVRFMLIGAGGGGGNGSGSNGGGGGGSGAITSWVGPAIFVPDVLQILVGRGGSSGVNGTDTFLQYATGATGPYILLRANGGGSGGTTITAGSGASAMSNNYFGASGIFTSISGQNGTNGGSTGAGINQSGSATTFLAGGAGGSGGAGSNGGRMTPNYAYPSASPGLAGGTTPGGNGYFIKQPILVGCGGGGGSTNTTGVASGGGRGGIGCGGGGSGEDAASGGIGGDGAVFVWAW